MIRTTNVETVLNRYNPENDAHKTTWQDEALARVVLELVEEVHRLLREVNDLKLDRHIPFEMSTGYRAAFPSGNPTDFGTASDPKQGPVAQVDYDVEDI